MTLTSNPDVIVTFTVEDYRSITQGTMLTAGSAPHVSTALVLNSTGRVARTGNGAFEVTGSAATGNPLVIQFEVLPAASYAIEALIVRNVNGVDEQGTAWDSVIIGNGTNDNKMTVRDIARKPAAVAAIDYELYLLVRPKQPADAYPIGDLGLIDPLWTNR